MDVVGREIQLRSARHPGVKCSQERLWPSYVLQDLLKCHNLGFVHWWRKAVCTFEIAFEPVGTELLNKRFPVPIGAFAHANVSPGAAKCPKPIARERAEVMNNPVF